MAKANQTQEKNIPISVKSSEFPLFSSFFPFQPEFNKLLKSFNSIFPTRQEFTSLNINPSIDIINDEKEFKIEAEMPGLDETGIKVAIQYGTLLIKGEKEVSRKDEGKNYLIREIGYGSYERRIPLPDTVDIDNAKASFKKGMLWVTIPKTANNPSQTKELKVEKITE